ncbi:MAG TPA: DUF1572 family protein [Thermoanaerobaculia bacterium]|nr:DUF1572 family protein [Thermoanaerobaculia bacterium]
MSDETLTKALESLRIRITKVLPAEVHDCLALLDDEQIWWRPNEQSNSIGNIVLHVSGSLNFYLNKNLGNIDYSRDREAEFAERRAIPKAELLAVFDDMVAKAERTFDGLTLERLGDVSPEPKMHKSVVEDVVSIAVHLANHVGQILWITKMLRGDEVKDLWMAAHKQYVWRRSDLSS